MKWFLFVLVYVCFLLGCKKESAKVSLDWCQMLADDQGENGVDRIEAFERNFKILLEETRTHGFPDVEFGRDDDCKSDLVSYTLIHIVQIWPELLFNEDVILLFSSEIDKGKLSTEILTTAINISSDKTYCRSLKPLIDMSVQKWYLSAGVYSGFKYEGC